MSEGKKELSINNRTPWNRLPTSPAATVITWGVKSTPAVPATHSFLYKLRKMMKQLVVGKTTSLFSLTSGARVLAQLPQIT
jgi:hypothetical protein